MAANLHILSCEGDPPLVRIVEWLIGRLRQTVTLMRTRLQYSIAIVACALLTFGCGSNAGAKRDDASSAAPVGSQGRQETVRLSGCVELAGMADYVLKRLHIEGDDTDAAPRTTVHPAPAGIIEGSWVRLTGSRDLPSLAGHRVVITGVVVDTGRNTIGTDGAAAGTVLLSGDVSQASTSDRHWTKVRKEAGPIARASIANGTAPEVKIIEVKDLGDGCHEAPRTRRAPSSRPGS